MSGSNGFFEYLDCPLNTSQNVSQTQFSRNISSLCNSTSYIPVDI